MQQLVIFQSLWWKQLRKMNWIKNITTLDCCWSNEIWKGQNSAAGGTTVSWVDVLEMIYPRGLYWFRVQGKRPRIWTSSGKRIDTRCREIKKYFSDFMELKIQNWRLWPLKHGCFLLKTLLNFEIICGRRKYDNFLLENHGAY